ncbi:hypothetical protein Aperf_G00000109448 [Anoplocephala perfoliata]
MALWCLNAQSKRFHDLAKKSTDSELFVILEELSNAAEALSIAAGLESPFTEPLHDYKCHADKILLFSSLETINNEGKVANIISKLNQKLPPHFKDSDVQSFRAEFAMILSSLNDMTRYVSQTWLPNREMAFEVLFNDVRNVVQQMPPTLLDQIGTRHHDFFLQAVKRIDTDFARILLSECEDANTEITESKLIQIVNAMESH